MRWASPPGAPTLARDVGLAIGRTPPTIRPAPVLVTRATRTAFERGGARVSLDAGLTFARPPASLWAAPAVAAAPAQSFCLRFPYAVLEVKLPPGEGPPPWLAAVLAEHDADSCPAPRFSKFLHAAAALYPGALPELPPWAEVMEGVGTEGLGAEGVGCGHAEASGTGRAAIAAAALPTPAAVQAVLEACAAMEGRTQAATNPTPSPALATPRLPGPPSSPAGDAPPPPHALAADALAQLLDVLVVSDAAGASAHPPSPSSLDDSAAGAGSGVLAGKPRRTPRGPAWARRLAARVGGGKLRPSGPTPADAAGAFPPLPAVARLADAKAFFANERTLIAWLQVTVLVLLLATALLSGGGGRGGAGHPVAGGGGEAGGRCPRGDRSCEVALAAGAVVAPVAVAFMLYAFVIYRRRTAKA